MADFTGTYPQVKLFLICPVREADTLEVSHLCYLLLLFYNHWFSQPPLLLCSITITFFTAAVKQVVLYSAPAFLLRLLICVCHTNKIQMHWQDLLHVLITYTNTDTKTQIHLTRPAIHICTHIQTQKYTSTRQDPLYKYIFITHTNTKTHQLDRICFTSTYL